MVRIQRKGNTFALLVGMQTGVPILENSIEVPQKNKNRTTLRPSNGTARYLSKGYRYAASKRHMHPNFIVALWTIAKVWKKLKCPSMDEWIKKM